MRLEAYICIMIAQCQRKILIKSFLRRNQDKNVLVNSMMNDEFH